MEGEGSAETHVVHHHKESAGKKAGTLLRDFKNKIKLKHILSGFVYLIIALAIFYPIAANMSTTAPGVGGDLYTNLWGIWWASYTVFQTHGNHSQNLRAL